MREGTASGTTQPDAAARAAPLWHGFNGDVTSACKAACASGIGGVPSDGTPCAPSTGAISLAPAQDAPSVAQHVLTQCKQRMHPQVRSMLCKTNETKQLNACLNAAAGKRF